MSLQRAREIDDRAARGEAIKRRLVENDRIDAARIFECRPVVEENPDAKPRAELRF
jgi:hypothetical protein